ncbi:MAG: TonB-dependent receptor domain-containing protein [Rhodothermales bacterium]
MHFDFRNTLHAPFLRASLWMMLLVCGPALSVHAQGKIAGRVIDATNGEPLIGANILIDGTQQGTVTDINGNYVILNVRPGAYTLVFSYIGYQTQRLTDVRVTTGQTTRSDVRLREQIIEGQEIVVQAERPLVQKDLTASKKTVIAEEIDALPVESLFGVLATQAGITQGAGGELHIRGGRSNEISYLVDGLSVSNPFNTNGIATRVATDAIQEMTVISGAFNAEYGKAMSGIVNLVTKEGGDRIDGSLSFYAGDHVTKDDDIFFTPSGLNAGVYTLEGSLGGPVPLYKRMRFFISARRDKSDGHIFGIREHLPSDSANFNVNPWYYEIHGKPWWEYTERTVVRDDGSTEVIPALSLPDERVPMNPSERTNILAKLSIRPARGTKLEYSFLVDHSERTPFVFAYRFNPDGVASEQRRNQNHSLHWTHTLNDRAFYTLRLSYAKSTFKDFLYEDPTDPRYVKDFGGIGGGNVVGFPGNNFLFGGNQKSHIYEDSQSFRTKLDITRQFGIIHEARAGFEVQLHSLDRENFVVLFDGNRYKEPTVEPVDNPSHDRYTNQRVLEWSAYIQDKLEFDNFIINAGLRFERFDPRGRYIADVFEPQGELADADPKNMLLPRLGVSFPITERGIIHFSYGHFAQMPTLRNLYLNPEFEFPKGSTPTFGNTNMRPERTVQYEVGLQQQLGDVLAFDITGYFKDIRDYLARQVIRYSTIAGEDTYVTFLNKAYANVKGVVVSVSKRRAPNGLLSATIDYTFQVAEGSDDDANAFFFNRLSDRENELEVVPLSFDQRHVLSSTVTLSRPGNWGISFIGQFATGYPYSPLILDQNIDLPTRSGRKPSQFDLDAHLFKEFEVGSIRFRAFAKVFNVFDRRNERFVFNDTGRATYSLSDERNLHATWEPNYGRPGVHTLDEYDIRPQFFSPPREIRLGLTLAF